MDNPIAKYICSECSIEFFILCANYPYERLDSQQAKDSGIAFYHCEDVWCAKCEYKIRFAYREIIADHLHSIGCSPRNFKPVKHFKNK